MQSLKKDQRYSTYFLLTVNAISCLVYHIVKPADQAGVLASTPPL